MRAVATVALAVSVVGSPLAGYCDDSNPAAMACCRDNASECNQPGGPTDDCCRKTPVDKDASTGPSQQLAGKPYWTFVVSLDALIPSATTAISLPSFLTPRRALSTACADLAPPPLSVLRV